MVTICFSLYLTISVSHSKTHLLRSPPLPLTFVTPSNTMLAITDNTHTLRLFSPHLLRLTAGFIPLLPAVERTHTHGPVPKKSGFWRLLVVKGGNTDKRTSLKRPAGNGKGKSTCCGKMQETHPGGGAVEGEAPIPERLRIRCEEGNAETEQHGN